MRDLCEMKCACHYIEDLLTSQCFAAELRSLRVCKLKAKIRGLRMRVSLALLPCCLRGSN